MPVYTHGHHESVLRAHRWRTVDNSAAYLLPYLRPGLQLLDIGCGPGTITADFARRVSPGRVCGLDSAAAIVDAMESLGLAYPKVDAAKEKEFAAARAALLAET